MAAHRGCDPDAVDATALHREGGRRAGGQGRRELALKELLVRDAYRIQIERRRLRRDRVALLAGQAGALPAKLAALDRVLRPSVPGEIGKVIKAARRRQSTLIEDTGELFLEELLGRGLVERLEGKTLGLFKTTRWRRTPSGDAWAASATEHVGRLQALPAEVDANPESAARAVAVAGALVLMVPIALAAVARLRRRSRRHGGDLDMDFLYAAEGGGGTAFDPFDAVGDLFDSALEGGLEGIDALDSALDSVADSIDSAVDAGVDSGGGDGGGDGGGGGD